MSWCEVPFHSYTLPVKSKFIQENSLFPQNPAVSSPIIQALDQNPKLIQARVNLKPQHSFSSLGTSVLVAPAVASVEEATVVEVEETMV